MSAPEMRMAKTIRIERTGSNDYGHIYIDGEPFLYYTETGPSTHVRRREAPGITITIVAESVEVVDTLHTSPVEERADDSA